MICPKHLLFFTDAKPRDLGADFCLRSEILVPSLCLSLNTLSS